MAAPNIVNVSTISGKTAVQAVSTSATAIVTNSAASGKVYKVNSLLVSNVDGTNTAEITIDLYRSSTAYHLIKTASITAGSTLDLLAKTIYLEEGDSVRLTASALSDLEAVCSYEEIDSTGSGAAGIFSTLTATGNTELGDAEATDTHAIKGATTLLANTSSDALRITQTGTGNALVVEDSANPDSTPFVVDTNGNVGIGTSSPSEILVLSAANNPRLAFEDVGNFEYTIGIKDNDAFTISSGGTDTERMRIDSSGNVGIGTGASISYQLQLSTDSAGKPSTNTWTVVSDERIKENIELADLDLCYDAVKNIPLKRFKWKDEVYSEEQVADRHKLGWIAQDVESVYPKAVNIHEFRYNQIYNETIIPATEDEPERIEKELVSEDVIEDCRNLNADQIYAAMYGAIQKLIQKVESQQSTIDALTARIEALEA